MIYMIQMQDVLGADFIGCPIPYDIQQIYKMQLISLSNVWGGKLPHGPIVCDIEHL